METIYTNGDIVEVCESYLENNFHGIVKITNNSSEYFDYFGKVIKVFYNNTSYNLEKEIPIHKHEIIKKITSEKYPEYYV